MKRTATMKRSAGLVANLLGATAVAGALAVMVAGPALGQANNSSTWQTPGNQTVPGYVPMCLNVSGLAIPCAPGFFSTPAGAGGAQVVAPNPYPTGSIAVTAVGVGTTGAVTATLPANATKFTYVCNVDVSVIGGVASIGPVTITNLMGNTFTYQLSATAAGFTFTRTFTPCIPTNAVNTAIVVATTADGTASAVNVNVHGFQL